MTIDPRFGLTERTWPSVIQTPISITGWKVTVATTAGIKVKQDATLSKPGQEPLEFEVKRVLNRTELLLGNKGQGQPAVSGITQFDGGTLIINEQSRNKLGDSPILRAVYEEEPTIAIRTVMVDQFGEKYSDTNRLPVAIDGDINIGEVNAEVTVKLTHLDNVPNPGDIADSTRIGDGTELLQINTDGSINVVDEQVADKLDITNTILTAIDTQLSTGVLKVDDDQTQVLLQDVLSQLESGGIIIGTEDGTPTGVQHVFVNNLKSMILASHDRIRDVVYLDMASKKNRRVDKFEFTSATFPGITLVREFNYDLVGTEYVFVNDNWTLI